MTRSLLVIALTLAWLEPSVARAYLDGAAFEDEAIDGGGGGRLFTGAPRDGYECSVCHTGGERIELAVAGIPAEGWEPGRSYDLVIAFPEGVRNAGAVVEIAGEQSGSAGVLEGLPLDVLTEADQCRGGAPAARTVDVADRTVARIDVCGARRAALRWTAPLAPVPSLRVFASVVAADDSGDPTGDRAGHIASALRARAEPELESGRVTAGCTASRSPAASAWLVALALLAHRMRRRPAATRLASSSGPCTTSSRLSPE